MSFKVRAFNIPTGSKVPTSYTLIESGTNKTITVSPSLLTKMYNEGQISSLGFSETLIKKWLNLSPDNPEVDPIVTMRVTVIDNISNTFVSGAVVVLGAQSRITGSNGRVEFSVDGKQSLRLQVTKLGFEPFDT